MTAVSETPRIGYSPEEIVTGEPTRSARYKWAVVVEVGIPAGQMVNAVACVAAATGALVNGLIARGGPDASGSDHPGLPWAGCTILGGTAEEIAAVRERAAARDDILVIDMSAPSSSRRRSGMPGQ